MNRSRGNRFLVWALAASLALHAVFAIVVRGTAPVVARDRITRVTIITRLRPVPVVAPQPPRSATTNPSRIAQHAPSLPSHANSRTGPPQPPNRVVGAVGPDVAGSPGPVGTPKPSCASPNVAAGTVEAIRPEIPEAAREVGATGTTEVKVSLLASGAIAAVTIYSSSGNAQLDLAAERAARASTFSPELRNCQPVAGDYLFRVDFQ